LVFNSWDEWVGVDRMMKFTEENVQVQNALNEKQLIEKNTKQARVSQITPKSSSG
jgi:mortality factor 4-like protein 1